MSTKAGPPLPVTSSARRRRSTTATKPTTLRPRTPGALAPSMASNTCGTTVLASTHTSERPSPTTTTTVVQGRLGTKARMASDPPAKIARPATRPVRALPAYRRGRAAAPNASGNAAAAAGRPRNARSPATPAKARARTDHWTVLPQSVEVRLARDQPRRSRDLVVWICQPSASCASRSARTWSRLADPVSPYRTSWIHVNDHASRLVHSDTGLGDPHEARYDCQDTHRNNAPRTHQLGQSRQHARLPVSNAVRENPLGR